MKYLAILFSAFFFVACGASPASNTNSPSTANAQTPISFATNSVPTNPVDFLLTSAATDFHEHGPKGPLQFRNVRVGHVPASDGKDQYLMCGEFLRTQEGEKNDWTKFATIKTSGYEQYIGDNIYCQKPNIVWNAEGDISGRLQKQFDSLQPK